MTGLFPIPDAWVWTTLGEVAEVVGGVTKDSKRQNDPSLPLVPYLRVANVQRGYLNLAKVAEIRVPEHTVEKLRLQPGDVLLNEGGDRDKLGRGWVWSGEIHNCIHQNHVFRARIAEDVLDPQLLAWYVNECARHWFEENATQSVNLASISKSKIQQLPVPIPPVAEQRRILATLEEYLSRLDIATSDLARCAVRLHALRDGALRKAVRGDLVRHCDESPEEWLCQIASERKAAMRRPREPADPVVLPGVRVPGHWKIASLDSLCYANGYGTSVKCEYDAQGAPVLRIPNIVDGEIDVSDLKYAADASTSLDGLYVEPGDLLFVRTNGSRDLIGRTAVVRDHLKAAFASYLIRYRLVPSVPPEWVQLVVSSPQWREHIERSSASSAGQYNLSMRTLAPLPIPIPPKEEMRRILAVADSGLSLISRFADSCDEGLRRSKTLRRAVLREAFAGRLVEQSPADEPASVLLERIRTERAVQGPMRWSRRGKGEKAPQEETLL